MRLSLMWQLAKITWNPFCYYAHVYVFAWNNTDETGDHLFSQSWLQNETKATSGPMAAHNKPLRWQNSDEAQAHLSTTRFHMQVAAPSSHRSRHLRVLPYQSLARSSGGEITGSEQSVRQSARLAHHMREERPLSHTRRVNIASV